MTFENEAQAIDALVLETNTESAPEIDFNTSTPTPPAPVDGATAEDSANTDLSPEEQRLAGLRLEDYTRKTQEIAPLRKFMQEAGIEDVSRVQQAWELASQLQSDPVGLFNTLQSHLSQSGLLQGSTQPLEIQQPDGEEYEEIELPPHIQQKLAMVDTLNQKFEQMQAQAAQAALEAEYSRQEHFIRELNPNYKEADMAHLHALAFSTGGNLEDANALYQNIVQHVLGNHIATKAGVPDSVTPPATQGHAVQPVTPSGTLEDAHTKAKEWLSQQGLLD